MQDHGFSARRNHGMVAVHEVVTMHEVEKIAWQKVREVGMFQYDDRSCTTHHAITIDQQ